MLVRYCMTYHHYNLYFIMSLIFFCFIMKIARPPSAPHLARARGCAPPSKSISAGNYKIQ